MNTTIAISTQVRDQIKEFGHKGESYDEILQRILDAAKERQLQTLLMDTKNTVPIEKTIVEAKKKWRR